MASKIINLVTLSTLAILAVSFGPTSTNALAHAHHQHFSRHIEQASIVKKKRGSNGRCRARTSLMSTSTANTASSKPSSSPAKAPASTPAKAPTSTPDKAPATTSSKTTPAHTTSKAVTSTASSPSSSSTSNKGSGPAPGSGKFGKKGSKGCLAWGNGDDVNLKTFKTDHVVGLYDWSATPPAHAAALGFDFWPMLWGGSTEKVNAFEKAFEKSMPGTLILAPNEPNEDGQASMTPQAAADLWLKHIEPKCKKGYKCCSPAMSSRPNGQAWMVEFMKACKGCSVDYQCVHWYDIGFAKFQKYITDYHNLLDLPILVTEFADQNFNGGSQASKAEIFQFLAQVLEWADNTEWILAVCPFGAMHNLQNTGVNPLNSLMDDDGTPSDLGELFINMNY